MSRIADLSNSKLVHGTTSAYTNAKCRCDACKRAQANYMKDWREKTGYKSPPAGYEAVQRWEEREGKYLVTLHRNMLQRCYNPNNSSYERYGARGISVHREWIGTGGYRRFADWMRAELGDRPDGMSIDRIDNDGDYEPGNLRWADDLTQAENRRPRRSRSS